MHVNLLFGFLGSGKTTLVKHLLAQGGTAMKTAVIVNEFGEVGIDGSILRGRNVDIIELNSGCLCCTLQGSLLLAVEELRDKLDVERVIVEATGVAQPAELLESLVESSADHGIEIGPLVTVVDTAKFSKLESMLGEFYLDQIENADIVVANKIDLATPEQVETATRQIRDLNPDARLIFAERCRIPPEYLFEQGVSELLEQTREELVHHAAAASATQVPVGATRERDRDYHDHGHQHGSHDHDHDRDPHADAPAQSFTVAVSRNAGREGVARFFNGLPDNVWRAKGFIYIDGRPCLVQYSLGQLEITPADGPVSDAIVFIGQAMDQPGIEARFALETR